MTSEDIKLELMMLQDEELSEAEHILRSASDISEDVAALAKEEARRRFSCGNIVNNC